MKFRTSDSRLAAASVAVLLLLSACGGGGGGGSGAVAAYVGTSTSGNGSSSSSNGSNGNGNGSGGSGADGGGSTGGTVSKVTIGGSISGLTASGLVLANNGTDRLGVANGATAFKFATALPFGSAYSVGLETYPSGQICSLSGQAGTASADVTSIAILCADWTAATATVSTFAGSTLGYADGTGASAKFNTLNGLAFDASGTLFVADRDNNMIRKVSSAGVVTTLAGSTTPGSTDGTGTGARFDNPRGIVVGANGTTYVADYGNHMIRTITPAGVVVTLAGSTTSGSLDGAGVAARFYNPWGLALDSTGNLFVADQSNHLIRKITPAGVVTTVAGTGAQGFANGIGTSASFRYPTGLAIDAADNLYVGDFGNNAIRKITPAGVVTTFAGSGAPGALDGTGTAATFDLPHELAVDTGGSLYVTDLNNHAIRKITPAGVVTTLAGSNGWGNIDGLGTVAAFGEPVGIAVDSRGNLFVSDRAYQVIRKIARTP